MKTLPLTVLVHEGPIARAYLAAMRSAGYRPRRIVLLVYRTNPSTRKPMGRFLPRPWRLRYAQSMQSTSMFFWCRWLHSHRRKLFHVMAQRAGEALDFPDDVFEAMLGRVSSISILK